MELFWISIGCAWNNTQQSQLNKGISEGGEGIMYIKQKRTEVYLITLHCATYKSNCHHTTINLL